MEEPEPIPTPTKKERQSKRTYSLWIVLGLILCFVALVTRTVQFNFFSHDNANNLTAEPWYSETILARPGDLVDRRGRLLATSVSAQGLYLIPTKIKSPHQTAQTLSTLLALDEKWVSQAIKKHPRNSYLWLAHRLTPQQIKQISASGLLQEEYGFQKEYLRCYPRGELASHLLGTKNINRSGIGEGGIEESYFRLIQGEPGRRIFRRDRRGIRYDSRIKRAPESGKTIVLSIDSEIQRFAEQGLNQLMLHHQPVGCSTLVMNPQTGDILASASFPDYDPNRPVAISHHAWLDQTVSFLFDPGTMLDPVFVAWGLSHGFIRLTDLFQVENRLQDRVKKNVASILSQSNSRGMQHIRKQITKPALFRALVDSGLGRNKISALPGEQPGMLLPLEEWKDSASTLFSNQHVVSVTPLQLITAYANIISSNAHIRPRYILNRIDTLEYLQNELSVSNRNESKKDIMISTSADNKKQNGNWTISVPLVRYINQGPGTRAQLHDYAVFGKGATSHKLLAKKGTFSEKKAVCTFICGAPANHPQLLVLVVVDQPTSGDLLTGDAVAAPIAAKILHQSLKYQQVPSFRSQVQASSEKQFK